MKRSFRATILVAMTLALATPALAQRTTGAISGTVKDASGAVLPGVTVSGSGPNIVGTQTATTNEHGFYRVINLPPGDYQVVISLTGFRSVTQRGLRVPVGGTVGGSAAPRGGEAGGEHRRRRGVVGRRHHLQRGRLELRPRMGRQRPAAPQQLLRPRGI